MFRFNRAIVRQPARSVCGGLRAVDRGDPSYAVIRTEHDCYTAALHASGVELAALPPLDQFPDSVFVEDTALLFTEGAILLRPGAPSRFGETEAIAPTVREAFEHVLELRDGFADGGDVLVTSASVMIGLSDRTDHAGAGALVDCLAELGLKGEIVETPEDVLHLKSACSILDEETVFCTPTVARAGIFSALRQVTTPTGEQAAANALRVNDNLLVGAGFPRTLELLDSLGYSLIPLQVAEIGKLGAGLSCMSLRWWDSAGD